MLVRRLSERKSSCYFLYNKPTLFPLIYSLYVQYFQMFLSKSLGSLYEENTRHSSMNRLELYCIETSKCNNKKSYEKEKKSGKMSGRKQY